MSSALRCRLKDHKIRPTPSAFYDANESSGAATDCSAGARTL